MWTCSHCGEPVDDVSFACWHCGADAEGVPDASFTAVHADEAEGRMMETDLVREADMLLATTAVDGLYPELEILGVVCGETVIGTDLLTKMLADVVNLVGGKSQSVAQYLHDARRDVTRQVVEKALRAGANGIMGLRFDYQDIGNGMMLVAVSGTAIFIPRHKGDK